MFSVTGKNAVVTGAAAGIGFGISKRLAESGANVLLVDVNEDALVAASKKLGGLPGRVAIATLDISDARSGAVMVQRCVEVFGSLDVLVNNAGIFPQVPMMKMTPELFDKVYRVNLRGLAFASQAAARQMVDQKKPGSIINIGSIDSVHPSMVGLAAYDASKGGVLMFTRNFALEVAPQGIRVNAILPGGIATEGTAAPLEGSGMSAEEMKAMMAQFTQRIPMKRMGVPDDIAKVAVFLASSAADYMTGASIVVDGGMLLS
jgi:2-deoxy-D-gluconate 3-dehydrogenase